MLNLFMSKRQKYGLSFVSDNDLFGHMFDTIKRFRTGMTLDAFQKNIVDPIKLTFDTHVYKRPIENVIDAEIMRQLSKTNESLIGYFHQNISKYVGNGWEVPNTGEDGFDVVNHGKQIFAEIKSKHDTIIKNTVLEKLSTHGEDMLKTFFFLSFGKYRGVDGFSVSR